MGYFENSGNKLTVWRELTVVESVEKSRSSWLPISDGDRNPKINCSDRWLLH